MADRLEVLIVEDEPVVVRAARRILEAEGLSVVSAEDGVRGLQMVAERHFGVVLCDLMLPGASGLQVLQEARAADPPHQVIMITGYATLENALASFRLGAFDFLPKPFDSEELAAVVGRAMRFQARPAGGPAVGASDRDDSTRYRLGAHCWVLLEADGSAAIGAAETFLGLLGEVEEIELPGRDERISQGRMLCRVRCRDGLTHRIWTPLSGRIIAANERLETDPSLLDRDPYEAGWLVKIIPTSLEEELGELSPIGSEADPAPARGGAQAPEE